MTLEAGHVSTEEDGTVTGTGLARELLDARVADFLVRFPAYAEAAAQSILTRVKQAMAADSNVTADVLVAHILANVEVTLTIGTSDAGLQRTPDPNDPATATLAPAAAKILTVTLR